MIREALRAVVLANPAASAALGGTRIYPLQMPQGVRDPSLVYQRVGGSPDETLDGPVALRETRWQFDAWAKDPDQAAALMAVVEPVLNGFTGQVAVGPLTCNIKGMFLDNEADGYDPAAKLYRERRDFVVFWCPA